MYNKAKNSKNYKNIWTFSLAHGNKVDMEFFSEGGGEISLKTKPRSKESSCSSILAQHKSRKYHKNIYENKSPPSSFSHKWYFALKILKEI